MWCYKTAMSMHPLNSVLRAQLASEIGFSSKKRSVATFVSQTSLSGLRANCVFFALKVTYSNYLVHSVALFSIFDLDRRQGWFMRSEKNDEIFFFNFEKSPRPQFLSFRVRLFFFIIANLFTKRLWKGKKCHFLNKYGGLENVETCILSSEVYTTFFHGFNSEKKKNYL